MIDVLVKEIGCFEEIHTPQVISPFTSLSPLVVGTKDMDTSLAAIIPLSKRLSVTVGIVAWVSGERVPEAVFRKQNRRKKKHLAC